MALRIPRKHIKPCAMRFRAAGQADLFSICEWAIRNLGNGQGCRYLWRITGTLSTALIVNNHGTWSSWGIIKTIEMRKGIRQYAGPDHWNDPDMMEVGRGMTFNEDRAHFSMWRCLLRRLLQEMIFGPWKKKLWRYWRIKMWLLVDQDSLGVQGLKYCDNEGGVEVWVKPLQNGVAQFASWTNQNKKQE